MVGALYSGSDSPSLSPGWDTALHLYDIMSELLHCVSLGVVFNACISSVCMVVKLYGATLRQSYDNFKSYFSMLAFKVSSSVFENGNTGLETSGSPWGFSCKV